jgi:hypothetical protein
MCQSLSGDVLEEINYTYGTRSNFRGDFKPLHTIDQVENSLTTDETKQGSNEYIKKEITNRKERTEINGMIIPSTVQTIGGNAKPKTMFKVKQQYKSKYF